MTLRKIDENMIDDKLTNKVNDVVAKAEELKVSLADTEKVINASSFPRILPESSDSARIQRAIDAAVIKELKNVIIPMGEYKSTATITIKSGITLIGYGAKFTNVSKAITFFDMQSETKLIGIEIEGIGFNTLDYNNRAVSIIGTDTNNRVSKIEIYDVYFHDLAGYGIYSEFANDVYIHNFKMQRIAYAGIMALSAGKWKVEKGFIQEISALISNTYGISFTQYGLFTDLSVHPRSIDCIVDNVVVEDNPNWEGLDSHGGENITFINCTVRRCKRGINIGSVNTNNINNVPPLNCSIINNTIYGMNNGEAIALTGTGADNNDKSKLALNCKIVGNTVYNGGIEGNTISGAIYCRHTKGLIIEGNTLENSSPYGIQFYYGNYGFCVIGNTIINSYDNSFSTPSGISFVSNNGEGTIDGNNFIKDKPSLGINVSKIAIYKQSGVTNINVSIGNNHNTFDSYIGGFSPQEVTHLKMRTAGFYSGTGSPEGAVTANPGSIFVDINGGIGKTLYIKQSNSNAFGWMPVNTIRAANTSGRPTGVTNGFHYFDTTLNKPIWFNGTIWVDATGITV